MKAVITLADAKYTPVHRMRNEHTKTKWLAYLHQFTCLFFCFGQNFTGLFSKIRIGDKSLHEAMLIKNLGHKILIGDRLEHLRKR